MSKSTRSEILTILRQAIPEIVAGIVLASLFALVSAIPELISSRAFQFSAALLLVGGAAAYVAFRRRQSTLVVPTRPHRRLPVGQYRFPRARIWAIVVLVAWPLVLSAVFVSITLRPGSTVVAVARFDGPEQDKYKVTNLVWDNLDSALRNYSDVEVVHTDQVFMARDEAFEYQSQVGADILIWGWYSVTEDVVLTSLHFDVIGNLVKLGPYCSASQGEPRKIPAEFLKSADMQLDLSHDISFLTLFTIGMSRYSAADWNGAIMSFDDAENASPGQWAYVPWDDFYYYRGTAHLRADNYQTAIDDLSRSLDGDDQLPAAIYYRALAYSYIGNYEEASLDMAMYLKDHNPNDSEAVRLLADYYSNLGQHEKALEQYSIAIQRGFDIPCSYIDRGMMYINLDEDDKAIADFDKALEVQPRLITAYVGKGAAYVGLRENENAVAELSRAIALDPNNAGAYILRAGARLNLEELTGAKSDFEKVLEISDDPRYLADAREGLEAIDQMIDP